MVNPKKLKSGDRVEFVPEGSTIPFECAGRVVTVSVGEHARLGVIWDECPDYVITAAKRDPWWKEIRQVKR